jgi:DNA-binding response OmpR family regulator
MSMHDRRLPSDASKSPLRIIVVDNDAGLRQQEWAPALRKHGFDTHDAGTAAELYRHMLVRSFDIVVLDMHLPDENGLAVTQHLRAMSDVGIVVLTEWSDRRHHARMLHAGADICLIKPVEAEMVAATLQSLARRLRLRPSPPTTTGTATMSEWRLKDGGWRLVSPGGVAIALTAAERSMLTMLVSEDGQPVSRESLLHALNRNAQGFDPHRMEMMIHRLRKKALAQAGERLPLLTVRGLGYLLACDSEMPVV